LLFDKASKFILGSHKIGDSRLYLSDANLIQLIEEAIHNGFLYLDTAPIYGLGKADKLLSKLILSTPTEAPVVVDTKIGLHRSTNKNTVFLSYDTSLIYRQIDEIINNYSGHLRFVYLHYPPADLRDLHPCLEALNQLVAEGLIAGIGLSNFSYAQMLALSDYTKISSIQLLFAPFLSHYPFYEIISILHYASQNMIHCSCYGTLSVLRNKLHDSLLGLNDQYTSFLSQIFSKPLTLGFDQVVTSLTQSFHLECLKTIELRNLGYSSLLDELCASPFIHPPLKF